MTAVVNSHMPVTSTGDAQPNRRLLSVTTDTFIRAVGLERRQIGGVQQLNIGSIARKCNFDDVSCRSPP